MTSQQFSGIDFIASFCQHEGNETESASNRFIDKSGIDIDIPFSDLWWDAKVFFDCLDCSTSENLDSLHSDYHHFLYQCDEFYGDLTEGEFDPLDYYFLVFETVFEDIPRYYESDDDIVKRLEKLQKYISYHALEIVNSVIGSYLKSEMDVLTQWCIYLGKYESIIVEIEKKIGQFDGRSERKKHRHSIKMSGLGKAGRTSGISRRRKKNGKLSEKERAFILDYFRENLSDEQKWGGIKSLEVKLLKAMQDRFRLNERPKISSKTLREYRKQIEQEKSDFGQRKTRIQHQVAKAWLASLGKDENRFKLLI